MQTPRPSYPTGKSNNARGTLGKQGGTDTGKKATEALSVQLRPSGREKQKLSRQKRHKTLGATHFSFGVAAGLQSPPAFAGLTWTTPPSLRNDRWIANNYHPIKFCVPTSPLTVYILVRKHCIHACNPRLVAEMESSPATGMGAPV